MRGWVSIFAVLSILRASPVAAQRAPEVAEEKTAMSEAKVVAAIIAASIAAYFAMGRPCACPYNTDRAGRSCGARSAHSRPSGFSPLCFPADVTPRMIAAFRAGHTITDKAQITGLMD